MSKTPYRVIPCQVRPSSSAAQAALAAAAIASAAASADTSGSFPAAGLRVELTWHSDSCPGRQFMNTPMCFARTRLSRAAQLSGRAGTWTAQAILLLARHQYGRRLAL